MRIYTIDTDFKIKVWRSRELFESQHSYADKCFLKVVTKIDLNTYTEQVMVNDEGQYMLAGVVFPESQAIAHNILVRLNRK